MSVRVLLLVAGASLTLAAGSDGARTARPAQAGPDSVAALGSVEQFDAALVAGDSAKAVSWLAEDLMIIEGGMIETRAEYLAHHLGADIKASGGAKGQLTVLKVTVVGDLAYIISKTVKPPTAAPGSTGSELAALAVVAKTGAGWKIRAIHWSSRRRRG